MDKVERLIEALEALSEDELSEVFDSEIFNDIVLGYTTIILKAGGQARENIQNGLNTMSFLFSHQDASSAWKAYKEFLEEEKESGI